MDAHRVGRASLGWQRVAIADRAVLGAAPKKRGLTALAVLITDEIDPRFLGGLERLVVLIHLVRRS